MNRRQFVVSAAALALAPRALAEPGRRGSRGLVTADLESRLVVVDLPGGEVVRHVPTLPFPRSIETVGRTAVVAHADIGAVSLVDGSTLEVTHALREFDEPRYTAAHPNGRHAYVTDAGRGDVAVVDVLAGRVVGRTTVGPLARHIAIHPAGHTLWIALGTKARELAVVDLADRTRPRLSARFRPPFLAHDVAWSPDGSRVWISSGDRDELAVYDASSGRVVARPTGDWPPQHITFGHERVYVASGWSGTLRVHRLDGRALRTTTVPVGSYNVQQADGWVLTPGLGRGSLCVLDRQGRAVSRTQVARSSHDACVVARL